MKGLSTEIEVALITIIEGLNYNFFATDGTNTDEVTVEDIETYIKDLDAEKMQVIMKSKTSSFQSAKHILERWMNSPNAPHKEKVVMYINRLIKSGESAIGILRKALAGTIDFSTLEPHKHDAAIKAKPVILEAIISLDKSIRELQVKLDSGDLSLAEKEFILGYPEKFAKGEFFPTTNYHKDWYDSENDAVNICPFSSTGGKVIVIDDLAIRLPEEPEKESILFHDLPKKEQYWRREEMPEGINIDTVDLWDDYIKEEFRRRREGIWFMNNGKAVYLTGNMYFALQWGQMFDNGGYMDFRYAQLDMFYFLEACIVDPRCLGDKFLKSRRTGFTYIILFILLNMATSTKNAKFGMTSKSGADVEEAFEKFSYAFLSLPFFLRPVVRGNEDSLNALYFGKPSDNSKEAKKSRKTGLKDYLNTSIDHRPTKNDSYDSVKLNGYLGDESDKWVKPHDYVVHLGMITPTMMPAGKVVGKAFIGSTMGAAEKGGKQGVEIINGSMVKDRDPITQKTSTGLYFHFLPAQENMEEFTDKYGKCWTTKPPNGTKNVLGAPITIGSIEYLMAVEDQKRKQSDKALNEQLRTYPRNIEHALRDPSENSIFNMTKLYEQIDNNTKYAEEQLYTVGNFNWKNGMVDGDVVFNPDRHGRFKVSWMPSKVDDTEHLQNRIKTVNGKFYPLNMNLVRFGVDPFSYASTHGKGSKGAIHGLTMTIPDAGPSNQFILEYIARPTDEVIFFEDVIKCVKFYGSPILVESNRLDLSRHMYNRGYRGFCMDRLDRPKNKLNANEIKYGGQLMSGKDILDSHINSIGSYIEDYVGLYTDEVQGIRDINEVGVMPFNETLRDWLSFDPTARTEYDATISSGLAIMACHKDRYRGKVKDKKKANIGSILRRYNNSGSMGTLIKDR